MISYLSELLSVLKSKKLYRKGAPLNHKKVASRKEIYFIVAWAIFFSFKNQNVIELFMPKEGNLLDCL